MDRGGKENGRNAFFSFLRSPKWPFISRPPPSPPPPLPLYSYAHSIRAFRGNALASISSTTLATDLVKRTNNDWTNERTDERTDGWTDGRTAFLKGHFVPLSRVFSLAGRAMSSLGAAGGGGRRVKGRRKRNEPRQGRGGGGRGGERERERGVLQPAYID